MKKILLPTDFSQMAENAFETARMLAKKNDAAIHFLHVIELSSSEIINTTGGPAGSSSFADKMIMDKSIQNAEEGMARLMDISKFQGIESEFEIRLGNPFDHIFETIKDHDIDFIVMGTKGSTGLNEMLIGSNTEKVVRKASCPVLAIKEPLTEKDFKDIVYATNFGSNEAGVVAALKDIQADFNGNVHLVWINTPNDFKSDTTTLPLLDKFVEDHSIQNCTTNVFSDVIAEDGIRHFADRKGAGIIVMGTNAYTGISRFIRGSITEDMINHAVRPVLSISMKE